MQKLRIEIKWGIIFALAGMLWMCLEHLMGLHDTQIEKQVTYTNFFAIPAVVIYVLALLDKKNNYYGNGMTFNEGLTSGMLITVVVMILSPLTQYISTSIISPDYFSNNIDYVVSDGKMTLEAATDYFNLKSFILQGLIFAPAMGALTSSAIMMFIRKKVPKGEKIKPSI